GHFGRRAREGRKLLARRGEWCCWVIQQQCWPEGPNLAPKGDVARDPGGIGEVPSGWWSLCLSRRSCEPIDSAPASRTTRRRRSAVRVSPCLATLREGLWTSLLSSRISAAIVLSK